MRRLIFIAIAALALAGCGALPGVAPGPTVPAVAPAPPPDPKTQMTALETKIEALIEEQREKLDPKAKALAIDPELVRIARARASDMADKNYLAHAAPNGDTSASLLMTQDAKWQGLLGENLAAQHYVPQSGVDPDVFAQRFVDTWMNSQPHRDNLAFASYDRTGVGAAVNGDTVYVAQLFATDLGLPPATDGGPASTVTSYPNPAAAQTDTPAPAPPEQLRGAIGAGPPVGGR
jgi:uncharacterized protein YkwD